MPFAAPIMSEEEELKNKNQNGVNISGESGTFSTGVPGQNAGDSSKPQKGSGDKFANIQSYLDANKDQGDQMGAKVAGDVSQSADTATQKVQDFTQKAPKVEAYDPSAAYQNVTTLSDQDKSAYNQAKGGYKGPQTVDQVEGYQDTQKAASQAASQVQNAGTEQGQRELLKQTYARPSYSAGENALDQTIVQNSPNSRKGFEDLSQKYAGINSLFDNASTDIGGKVNQSITQGLANQRAIAEGEAKVLPDILNPIRARADQQTKDNVARIGTISEDLGDDVLSDDTLAMLGLGEGQKLWDMNLSNYLTPNYTEVGINNAATADERAKYAALTALINGTAGNEITADGQAINPLTFNREQFDSDFAGKSAEMDRIAKAASLKANQYVDRDGTGDPFGETPYSGSVNLADYLARGEEAFKYVLPTYFGTNMSGSDAENAKAKVISDLRKQVNKWLEDNKYNRAIKKG